MPSQFGMTQALDPLRLALLVEVERRGSVSAAATALGMGQPSASKHLQALAGAVGERLVERHGRGTRLTPSGRVVATHAARVLGTLRALEEDLDALRGGRRGTLALAASSTPGTYLLPGILRRFAGRYPDVAVDVAIGPSAWVIDQVARSHVRVGLAGQLDPRPGVAAEPFLDDEIVGVARPGDLRPRGGAVRAAQLAGQTLLVGAPGSSTRAAAERALAAAGHRPRRTWELDTNEAIKRAVLAGLGVGFLSRLAVRDELERRELVAFRLAGRPPIPRHIHLVRPAHQEPTPTEQAFARTLREFAAAFGAQGR
jgi:molybdate transport repressor ModE-like protein